MAYLVWSGHGPPQHAKREIKGKVAEVETVKDKDGNVIPQKINVNICVWNAEVTPLQRYL